LTLFEWIVQHEQNPDFLTKLKSIITAIRHACNDLKVLKLVHGDLHPANICIDEANHKSPRPVVVCDSDKPRDWRISLIDWGWCQHCSFTMQDDERLDYENKLKTDWDWTHFRDSMAADFDRESWLDLVDSVSLVDSIETVVASRR
jgi:RIO-like serine/threonine protein kinase